MNNHPPDTLKNMLKEIFSHYKSQKNSIIDITSIREFLAFAYAQQGLFDLNSPADSIEALIEILSIVHKEFESSQANLSRCCCPSHQAFGIQVEETLRCRCGKERIQPWDLESFAHPVYVAELFVEVKLTFQEVSTFKLEEIDEFFERFSVVECERKIIEVLKNNCYCEFEICAGGSDDCVWKTSEKFSKLLNVPRVYAINLIWENSRPSMINHLQQLHSIPIGFNINSIFKNHESQHYSLLSFIVFGSGHYLSFICKNSKWYSIDDKIVKFIGGWKQVTIYLLKSKYYPVGLFYTFCDDLVECEMNLRDWMELEYHIMSIAENSENSPNRKIAESWKCKCGHFNNSGFESCEKCYSVKAGVNGWVCSFCTFLNDSQENSCLMCQNTKDSVQTRRVSKGNFNMNMRISKQKDPVFQKKQLKNDCKLCKKQIDSQYGQCPSCLIRSSGTYCKCCRKTLTTQFCEDCLLITNFCNKCNEICIDSKNCLCSGSWQRIN